MFAGELHQLHRESGEWAFVDVGFARESKSSGLLIGDGPPSTMTFANLQRELVRLSEEETSPLNLVLEAPLSVAFTAHGNPAGRSMEKSEHGHRYWYAGLGCQVTVSAAYLLRAILNAKPRRQIRLFEAFVSFKAKGTPSSHSRDVEAMRTVVWRAASEPGDVVGPSALLGPDAKIMQSAFAVCGLDLGIPPVVVASAA
jgi:hypothetical protein